MSQINDYIFCASNCSINELLKVCLTDVKCSDWGLQGEYADGDGESDECTDAWSISRRPNLELNPPSDKLCVGQHCVHEKK